MNNSMPAAVVCGLLMAIYSCWLTRNSVVSKYNSGAAGKYFLTPIKNKRHGATTFARSKCAQRQWCRAGARRHFKLASTFNHLR
jgi:hypothetical protein